MVRLVRGGQAKNSAGWWLVLRLNFGSAGWVASFVASFLLGLFGG